MSKPESVIDDFDEMEMFDEDFDIETFIDAMEGPSPRKRRRRNGRHRMEQRLEERLLREELADWDSYDET